MLFYGKDRFKKTFLCLYLCRRKASYFLSRLNIPVFAVADYGNKLVSIFNNIITKPKLVLETDLISDDPGYDDQRLQTFNPLYTKGAYFGLAAFLLI